MISFCAFFGGFILIVNNFFLYYLLCPTNFTQKKNGQLEKFVKKKLKKINTFCLFQNTLYSLFFLHTKSQVSILKTFVTLSF